jgi:ubiquinone/menaquinone biosynthesis C-methylase UbiE
MNVAVLLQALRVTPGMTVVEFGAGTGWLSRFLTQLGCRAILVDVSPTALRIARELYRRQPVVGDRPEPHLEYDGRRIALLPDASVDRILCFDAFHHAPDPDAIVREFGRLLTRRDRRVLSQDRAIRSGASQFETRTYGVVGEDVDVTPLAHGARLRIR